MGSLFYTIFNKPLGRPGFAIRFFIMLTLAGMARVPVSQSKYATIIQIIYFIYMMAIVVRRCNDFDASTGKKMSICIIMCIPFVGFIEGIYLCFRKGKKYYTHN